MAGGAVRSGIWHNGEWYAAGDVLDTDDERDRVHQERREAERRAAARDRGEYVPSGDALLVRWCVQHRLTEAGYDVRIPGERAFPREDAPVAHLRLVRDQDGGGICQVRGPAAADVTTALGEGYEVVERDGDIWVRNKRPLNNDPWAAPAAGQER